MQELRLVAVSEDGSYLVLATAGRGTRFTLPVDDRLRAVVRGHFSRLGQYEIEVESPLRPKEIQARIRAGETAEEIAETAGIPVERVRWFEGPVLQEREYIAQQAQRVTVRRPGESSPAPPLGEIVEERLGKRGVDLEEVEWDSRKCEDSTWRVRLSFSFDGRPHAAEWAYDPRRRHISAVNEEAARLSSLDLDESVDDTVTPFLPRRAMKVVGEPVQEQAPPQPAPAPREEAPAAEEAAIVREVPRQDVPRQDVPRQGMSKQEVPKQAPQDTEPSREAAPPREAEPPRPRETRADVVTEPRGKTAPKRQAAPAAERTAPAPRSGKAEPARPAARREPAEQKPAEQKPAEHERVEQKPVEQPAETVAEQPAAAAAGGRKPAAPAAAQEKPPSARKKARGKRASVPSWDEIMFGARRPE
jgi:hypothetical protein